MSLILNEEQILLKDSAVSFVADRKNLNDLRLRRKNANSAEIDTELWQQIVSLGWAAIPFGEAYGGLDLGYAELGIVLEELGRGLLDTPLISSVVLAGSTLDIAGSETQKSDLLPAICDGSKLFTLAYQETPRHDPYAVTTSLEQQGDKFTLNGAKRLVMDGGAADKIIVLARSSGASGDRAGLSLVLVDRGTPGVTIKNNLLIDGRRVANITFDNVGLDADSLVGDVGRAGETIDKVLTRAAIALSAEMVGGSQTAFDMTLEYLKVREQFGAKIGSFQGLKHRAARWFCELELCKSIVLAALRAIDDDDKDLTKLGNACKARASNTYQLSGKEGIQMHGGIGVTDEHDIGLYMKSARVTELMFGDATFHQDRFATNSGY